MRLRIIFILLSITALLLMGCDRFERELVQPFQPANFSAGLFTPLGDSLQVASADNLAPVKHFFSPYYLHSGGTRADLMTWLGGIYLLEDEPVFEVSFSRVRQVSASSAVADWRLKARRPDWGEVLADTTFVDDELIRLSDGWKFLGNGLSSAGQVSKQHVIVEYFTFLGCPNCPPVEAQLRSLAALYPGRFTFLEYHTAPPLQAEPNTTYNYYTAGLTNASVPLSVLQGQTLLQGNQEAVLNSYVTATQGFATQESGISYEQPSFAVNGRDITGNIVLNCNQPGLNITNMVLNVVLIEEEVTAQGQTRHNVVRGKARIPLTADSPGQPVSFLLRSATEIAEDCALVIFAQTMPATFDGHATIHGGIKTNLFGDNCK
jgi:hypothetical protein